MQFQRVKFQCTTTFRAPYVYNESRSSISSILQIMHVIAYAYRNADNISHTAAL
jgi:hypothetical protein